MFHCYVTYENCCGVLTIAEIQQIVALLFYQAHSREQTVYIWADMLGVFVGRWMWLCRAIKLAR
jgi:hypothetical protein